MTNKLSISLPLYVLVGGPKNVPLMLEQSGLRYATLFTTEETVTRFQQTCCSLDSYQSETLSSSMQAQEVLQTTRKFGCSLLVVDPPGPEIDQHRPQPIALFLRQLAADTPSQPRRKR